MSVVAIVLVVLVALLHLYFLVLEMFLWTRPLGLKVFRQTPEQAAQSKVLAANQGLYNGFLAAGLLYGVATGSREFCLFFLACVVVAGAYGAMTVNSRIFFVQALPALLAIGRCCCASAPSATPTSRSARGHRDPHAMGRDHRRRLGSLTTTVTGRS